MGGMKPFGFGGEAGPFRLGNPEMAPQVSWFIPLALLGIVSLWRRPKGAAQSQLWAWAGWMLSFGIVFSLAKGIVHQYYLSALAPGVAALAGIGLAWAISKRKEGDYTLAVAALATLVWQSQVVAQDGYWKAWLVPIVLGLAILSVLGLVLFGNDRRWTPGLAVAGSCFAPFLYALTPVVNSGNAMLPAAGPQLAKSKASAAR